MLSELGHLRMDTLCHLAADALGEYEEYITKLFGYDKVGIQGCNQTRTFWGTLPAMTPSRAMLCLEAKAELVLCTAPAAGLRCCP